MSLLADAQFWTSPGQVIVAGIFLPGDNAVMGANIAMLGWWFSRAATEPEWKPAEVREE